MTQPPSENPPLPTVTDAHARADAAKKRTTLSLIVTGGALAVALVHVVEPDFKIDGVTLGLLALAALPWLAPLIKSVELPGVGKVELRDVETLALNAAGGAASAVQKSELALAQSAASRNAGAPLLTIQGTALRENDGAQEISALAEEYGRLRSTQPSGPARTSALTKIVGKMIALAPTLNGFEIDRALQDAEEGRRLFAYAYLNARPDFGHLPALIDSVTRTDNNPFAQYWGIQALEKVIGARGNAPVDPSLMQRLQNFLAHLSPGTDRYYEMDHLLRSLQP